MSKTWMRARQTYMPVKAKQVPGPKEPKMIWDSKSGFMITRTLHYHCNINNLINNQYYYLDIL